MTPRFEMNPVESLQDMTYDPQLWKPSVRNNVGHVTMTKEVNLSRHVDFVGHVTMT